MKTIKQVNKKIKKVKFFLDIYNDPKAYKGISKKREIEYRLKLEYYIGMWKMLNWVKE